MITLYRGRIGAGKTLTMVKDALKYYHLGYRVLSNFSLSFGDKIDSEKLLLLNRDSGIFNCVLVIDEIQLFFDSRNYTKKENKDFSYFIQQLRKRNVIILCTTQYVNTIDLRLRQHLQYVVYPNFDKKSGVVRALYFDLTLMEDLGVKSLVPKVIYYYPFDLYGLYDTYEMLK